MKSNYLKAMGLLSICLTLMACQSTSYTNATNNSPDTVKLSKEHVYLDMFFRGSDKFKLESEEDIFHLSNEMHTFIKNELLSEKDYKKRIDKISFYVFSGDQLGIEYNQELNLTASQTFATKQANCLSLTIMTYAIAKASDLTVRFQKVKVPEYWSRNGQFNTVSGHVNLVLNEKGITHGLSFSNFNKDVQVDFNPPSDLAQFEKETLHKHQIVALFYNNKGAQAMVRGEFKLAYAYLKQSTLYDQQLSEAWSNLGILYRLNNKLDAAKVSYQKAIDLNPENLTALQNYAKLLRLFGDFNKAADINAALARKRSENPFFHAMLAEQARIDKNYQKSITLYRKAIRMNKSVHEFHFGLAKTYIANKQYDEASQSLQRAIKINQYRLTEQRYVAKLSMLTAKL